MDGQVALLDARSAENELCVPNNDSRQRTWLFCHATFGCNDALQTLASYLLLSETLILSRKPDME